MKALTKKQKLALAQLDAALKAATVCDLFDVMAPAITHRSIINNFCDDVAKTIRIFGRSATQIAKCSRHTRISAMQCPSEKPMKEEKGAADPAAILIHTKNGQFVAQIVKQSKLAQGYQSHEPWLLLYNTGRTERFPTQTAAKTEARKTWVNCKSERAEKQLAN